jgi:hypothetical protein
MKKSGRCRMLLLVVFLIVLAVLAVPAVSAAATLTVPAGQTVVVDETTSLTALTVEDGGILAAPAGHSLTLTVGGIETGQALVTTDAVDTRILPGVYTGKVVLTVAEATPVVYQPAGPPGTPTVTFPFRQAIYVDGSGYVAAKSVPAAAREGVVKAKSARDVKISSTGECFDGVYVGGGSYRLASPVVRLRGNGRSDFIGYGAAIAASGKTTRLVVNHADIVTRGVVRAAVTADDGSNVIVKNSTIVTRNGVLPADYVPTIDTAQMRSVPWMLSLSGNVRSTNLLGTNTKASYIKSNISSEGWGVLSTDGCTTPKLTAIDSRIAITGKDGYGSYGIGDATERFLGCTFDVATYATISRGSYLYYGDSTRSRVANLNRNLDLRLTQKELDAIPVRPTIVNSDRFGIMWHGGGTLDVSGGTRFTTKETTFLDKGQAIAITVDGSRGAKLTPANGVLMQVMDDDDPGPEMPAMTNTGVYHEPTGTPDVDATHDVKVVDATDALATFRHIALRGDFYNSTRGGLVQGPFGPPSSASKNMGLTFDDSRITGVITSSTAAHAISTITAADYAYLGEVSNTPAAAINNGVVVKLMNGSIWKVTATAYLTGLTIDGDAALKAPLGKTVSMTVDGEDTPVAPGTYSGAIVLTVK